MKNILILIVVIGCSTPSRETSNNEVVIERQTLDTPIYLEDSHKLSDTSKRSNVSKVKKEQVQFQTELVAKEFLKDSLIVKGEEKSSNDFAESSNLISYQSHAELVGEKKIDHKYFTLKLDDTFHTFNLTGIDSKNYSAEDKDQSIRLETEFGPLSLTKDKIVTLKELELLENFQWININESAISYMTTSAKFRNLSGSIYVTTNGRFIKAFKFSISSSKLEELILFLTDNLTTK